MIIWLPRTITPPAAGTCAAQQGMAQCIVHGVSRNHGVFYRFWKDAYDGAASWRFRMTLVLGYTVTVETGIWKTWMERRKTSG
jgi:hypothetical protein